MSKQIAIVTGGIGDIGTAMCRQLTELGNKVIAACFEAKSEKAAEWKKNKKQMVSILMLNLLM